MPGNWFESIVDRLRRRSGTGSGRRDDPNQPRPGSGSKEGESGSQKCIRFERTGGFAGLQLSTTIDANNLEPPEVERLEKELQQAQFFELPPQIKAQGAIDQFIYLIDATWEDKHNTVEVGEAAAPEQLCSLIEHLESLLRSQRGRS